MCVGPEAIVAMGLAAEGTAAASTIATVASVGMGAMTGITALGTIQQGKAQQQMANYNAQVAQNQAIAARQKAEFEEKAHRRQVAQLKGTQRAGAGASGGELLDMGDIFDMTAEEAELDALAIRYGGQMGATAAQQRATLARMEGRAAKQASYTDAGKTLLTGAKSGLALL